MLEPSGTPIDVIGLPNRQSKVPRAAGMTRQSIPTGAPNSQSQDDAGYGKVGTGGIADGVPGKTQRLSDCLPQAQDAGSHQAAFAPGLGPLGKGDKGNGNAGPFNAPEFRSTKAQGQQPKPGRGDIGVNTSSINGMPPGTLD